MNTSPLGNAPSPPARSLQSNKTNADTALTDRAATLDFIPVDEDTFPAIRLARLVGQKGGSAPAVFNAANEVCVEAFRARRISFLDIMDTVEAVIDRNRDYAASSLERVLEADLWARETAMDILSIHLT